MAARFLLLLVALATSALASTGAEAPTSEPRGRASTRGLSSVVYSDPAPLPLFQGLIRDVSPPGVVSQDVDLVNQRFCAFSDSFGFTLNQPATVTLEFRLIGALGADGSPELGSPLFLLENESLAEGGHGYAVTPSGLGGADLQLPPGTWQWTLTGVSAVDGHDETRRGTVVSRYAERDALPIGHVVVKGVDLWDGHLVVSREDFSIAGRGPDLSFARTYSSAGGGPAGPLGVGWAHTWESRVVVTACGEAIVIGGEGSGMRFVDDGAGGLRPLKGYHGSLVADPGSAALDFYTTGGTRYHYGLVYQSELLLEWVEDPYGNRLTLTYSSDSGRPRPVAVRDVSGRTLRLIYEPAVFALEGEGFVLTRVEGPGGIALDLSYDPFGNLVEAAREPHGDGSPSRVERYEYALAPDDPLDARHLLVAVRDEVTGAVTRYEYERGVVGFQGNVQVPRAFVSRVIEPEGGETVFDVGIATAGDLGGVDELSTAVTDGRGKTTHYTLDRYGSPLSILDPVGNLTEMTWAADDVVMISRTDGKGTTTAYTHDEHGNVLTETVTVVDFDGQGHTYTTTNVYDPPESFDPPYLKNRPASTTDRNGHVTTFEYDPQGGLTRQAVTGTDSEGTHTYFANGDRASTNDSRGHTVHFTYDAYGNPSSVTDPLGKTATTEWDVRGRPVIRFDRLGRVTATAYDTLDRPVQRTLPKAAGEPEPPVETLLYDDAGLRLVATDAAGRTTETRFDLEGRPVEVIDAEGATRLFEYDPEGNKTLETSWFDAATPRFDTTFEYDDAGRLVRRDEPLGRTLEYGYDGAGNVLTETLTDTVGAGFEPRVTEHAYDALDRRIRTRRLLTGGEQSMAVRYDGNGNAVLEVDPLGRETAFVYDPLNRLVEKIEPEWRQGKPRTTRYVYDGDGNLLTETLLDETLGGESADRVKSFAYDELSRLVEATDAVGAATLFEYDTEGNRIREIDPKLNLVRHDYDARNRLVRTTVHLDRVTDPARQVVTEYAHDAVGNRIEERWPNGNVVQHVYDGLDRLLSTTDSLGPVASFEYDARGLRTAALDANGNRTETDYDALGRAVEKRLPENRTMTMSWDVAGNQLTETDARGHTTSFEIDRLDRRVRTIDPAPSAFETSVTYDLAGNKLTETDRRGNTRSFAYDALDRLVRTTDPEPFLYEATFGYDAAGNLLRETDRRGIVTTHAYDGESRRIETRRADLVIESVEYDENGNRRFITDANGHVTGFEVDERDLLTAENRPLAAITRHTLDDMGDVVETVDPEGRVMASAYDPRRRRIEVTDGASETTVHAYDGSGNKTSTTLPESNVWTYRYDAADRLVEVEDPTTAVTAFAYDANSNLITQTDANLNAATFAYDELNRRVSKTYPGGGAVETMAYDPSGNPLTRTDPEGKVTTYAHDALDRETLRSYPPPAEPTGDDLASIATVFDPNNNPTQATETRTGPTGDRVTTKTYDAFDRLLSVTDPDGKALTYGYDAAGNRIRLTDPDGRQTLYAFDELNRPVSVTLPNVGVTAYSYFRDSRLKSVAHPNGTRSTQTYDAAGRIATILNTQGTPGATVSSYEYDYDGNGNRIEQIEINGGPAETTTYSYDLADRLLSVAYPDRTVSYTYDPAGNRLTELETEPGGAVVADKTYAYDARDRLLSVTDAVDPTASATYTFDANGNRTSQARAGIVTEFLYDARDQLTEVRRDATLLESYRYDYQGLRNRKAGPAGIFRYVYDDQSVLLQTDAAGLTVAKYDYGPDRLLSLAHATEGRQYYLFDGLGSVVDLTKPDGALSARYQYDAWGNPRGGAGASFNPFGFTGHERDDETGLYYAKARYYDPELGLWLTEDPFQGEIDTPPSLHRYLYAFQNPTVYVDPTGRQNTFTPAEFVQDSDRLRQLEAELSAARAAAERERASLSGSSRPMAPTVLPANRRLSAIEREIEDLRGRIGKAEEFFQDVLVVIEGAETAEAREMRLLAFLKEKGGLTFDERVRLITALIGPRECDVNCQRMPNLSDETMRALAFLESTVGNIALLGLVEIGLLTYVDDAVRATALLDDLRYGDDAIPRARPTPSQGPLKNPSGNLDEAAQAARTQPHGPVPAAAASESTGAESAANRLRLEKQLASEQQVGELTSGGGQPIAGAGQRVPIRDVERLVKEHGGSPGDVPFAVDSRSRRLRV
jgi:RHS repeat-associated protein